MNHLTIQEQTIIRQIQMETERKNKDNITRTEAYFEYFKKNPDLIWSFLASMVSRNGGWNMCDLEGDIFPKLLKPQTRKRLFLTYERANWLIFHDVFPQLLLYQYSTKMTRPMFHLLPYFHVSEFIQKEWWMYWKTNDQWRLTTSLIINEQNVIQTPVIEHPVYKKRVFHSLIFSFQDLLHFSNVILPTCSGELFGASVNGFRSISKRINLGKRLVSILFDRQLYPYFYEFAEKTAHTGSRYDYEQYFKTKSKRETPILRATFPLIQHHRHHYKDWSLTRNISSEWLQFPVNHHHPVHLTEWYFTKKKQLRLLLLAKQTLNIKLRI